MICSKCKTKFNCNKEDIKNCHCNVFNFNNKTKKIIKNYYNDCLCNDCLNKFLLFEQLTLKEKSINNENNLKNGLHYKVENSLWVFTEYYHYLRGKCCKNNCKNCIYK